MRVFAISGVCLGVMMATGAAWAQSAPPSRARGVIESISGDHVSLKLRDGMTETVSLTSATKYIGVKHGEIGAIKANSYIGAAAAPQPDGTLTASEVAVFPESMRGSGDGHYPWDLPGANTMTNGAVGKFDMAHGRTMTVTYKGGEQKIMVPETAPIVMLEPGERDLLKSGVQVVMVVHKDESGALLANAVIAGEGGVTPPM